jgi:hypothetical protein
MYNREYVLKCIIITVAMPLCSITTLRAAHDFAYYEQKTRTFLNYYGCQTYETVTIQPIKQTEKRPGWIINAFTNSTGIYLNMEEFEQHRCGLNLFICAHEAAHWVFHGEHSKITYELEQDADVKAAEMLCSHGYAWVVQEKIDDLREIIEDNADLADRTNEEKPRPTIRTRHQYLTHILESYLEMHPMQKRILHLYKGWDTALLVGSHTLVGVSCLVAGIKLHTFGMFKKIIGTT